MVVHDILALYNRSGFVPCGWLDPSDHRDQRRCLCSSTLARHVTYVGCGRNGRHVQHLLRKTPSVGRRIILLRTFLRFHSCHNRLVGDDAGQADRFKRFHTIH